jgi:hypothetical protein
MRMAAIVRTVELDIRMTTTLLRLVEKRVETAFAWVSSDEKVQPRIGVAESVSRMPGGLV